MPLSIACVREARLKACIHPGTGYAVCETLVKMFNAQGASAFPFRCAIPLNPNVTQFSRPEWQELDIQQHLELVYRMESAINLWADPPWRTKLGFERWRELFNKEFFERKERPRLLKTRLSVEDGGSITVLAYDRSWGCQESTLDQRQITGMNLFVYDEGSDRFDDAPINPLYQNYLDIISFAGKYFLTHSEYNSLTRREDIQVNHLIPVCREGWQGWTIESYPKQQCEIRATFPATPAK